MPLNKETKKPNEYKYKDEVNSPNIPSGSLPFQKTADWK